MKSIPLVRIASSARACALAALAALAALLSGPALLSDESAPVLAIAADHVTAQVSPLFNGLMTEEINHAYDGGIYAELVNNRAFDADPRVPAHWSLETSDGASATMRLDDAQPLSSALPRSLRVEVTSATDSQRVGVANEGYWGVPVQPRTRYRLSFYARSASAFAGSLIVSIASDDGATVQAEAEVGDIGESWQRHEVSLTTGDVLPSANNHLVISIGGPGVLWFNLVSLFPPTWHDRPNGNRIDLMQKLADLKPKFLRFPGGNYLEGASPAGRFDWKTTLHDLTQRPGHPGYWRYPSSDGLGLLEFLEWCEDLDMQPLLCVYAGGSHGLSYLPPGPQLQPFVQDALDEIEYAIGGSTTPWGRERARDGHPPPFRIAYVEIGNEDYLDKSGGYDGRFAQFHDALKARYPQLQLIATTEVKSRTPDVYDEHHYASAREFYADAGHYDRQNRNGPKILVGEWSTVEGTPTPDLNAALGDAVWMTGLERNSDVVIMQAYAPLLANVNPGAYQYPTSLIGFDAIESFGSPSYYAQRMFNANRGDEVLETSSNVAASFFSSVTRDRRTGAIYLKAVNAQPEERRVRIEITGASSVGPVGRSTVLSGQPADMNSLGDPEKIVPVETRLSGLGPTFEHAFPPYSVTVLQIPAQ